MRHGRARTMTSAGRRPKTGAAAISLVPMAAATAGAWFDEHTRLGFTTWRSACRGSGLTLSSLLTFTVELLPTAVIGALLGGLAVLIAGLVSRQRACAARVSLAAHAGCLAGMAVGLWLCTLTLPVPILLGVEAALGAACAAWLFARFEEQIHA